MDNFVWKILLATLWIWLPLYALILLVKEIGERRKRK